MLEDQVAFLLQKYIGNYVKGLSREALQISVWRGDVELTNMQLKPEALNALKLPVKVKAGFLGSVKLKVPWSRLGQEPVLVYLDRIFLLVEPATQVEGRSEDSVQEAKKTRIREMEIKLLESRQQQKSDVNTSWLGSLINTIIGNLKLSITNIHVRYEDRESNPGHPFAAGLTLSRLSAVTVDDSGKETFATGGALEHIRKSVELQSLAIYLDSDICPWSIEKPWEQLLPSEWSKVFEVVSEKDKQADFPSKVHSYALEPVSGSAKYAKLRPDESKSTGEPLQKAAVNLDDVTLCLSKDGYRDIMKLADNFSAFNQRLKYAHFRPPFSVKSNPHLWWRYAYKAVSDQMKRASGKMSWEQVLRYARLRKRYISLYVSLLKADLSRLVVDDNKELDDLDRELDAEVILQWRMLAHQFVEQSTDSDLYMKKQKPKKSWWSLVWSEQSNDDESEDPGFSEEDWERLNAIIGYKESSEQQLALNPDKKMLHTVLEIHMKHNASKLIMENQEILAELSCEGMGCDIKLYSEAKIFDLKLGSYRLSSPNGILAESAAADNSLVGLFAYKPLDVEVDWSLVMKASPCYITYLRETIEQIVSFFRSSTAVSQTIALETVAAVQLKLHEVKRTAQQQMKRALKNEARFFLNLDIAAPKITIPTEFYPDNSNATKLLLDLGNLMLRTQDDSAISSLEERDLYMQFSVALSDVSAFLVDGDYQWNQNSLDLPSSSIQEHKTKSLPVIDKCGVVLNFQQIRFNRTSYPSTRVALRLPSLGFHFSPSRYHRLMQVAKIFQNEESDESDLLKPWKQADFEGWLSVIAWKGVGSREAVWQRRYLSLVGPFLYVLENPDAKTYKQWLSLRGKQVCQVPPEFVGSTEHVLAICEAGLSNIKVVEHVNALILQCESDESRKAWQSRLQGSIYRASDSAAIVDLSGTPSTSGEVTFEVVDNMKLKEVVVTESLFVTGVLDELRIRFSCSKHCNQDFEEILLTEESPLLEFRATGGQVELSVRANDMFIGTVLKSMEVEDLWNWKGMTHPRYIARAFIETNDTAGQNMSYARSNVGSKRHSSNEATQTDGEEKFFEASEELPDLVESPFQAIDQQALVFDKESILPPSFDRIAGLLPDADFQSGNPESGRVDTLESFVKAQIVFFDQDSPSYSTVDKEVRVTLATLSFFCHRPTILAVLKFVDAINAQGHSSDPSKESSVQSPTGLDARSALISDTNLTSVQEPVVKGLLGKGKSRVIFCLSLKMSQAQIFLMNEDGTHLATLSQTNLVADIKVFPSSFGIKAALGNLKISDDSLPSDHPYFWVCDMRNPLGSSFVELDFSSYSDNDEDYKGFDYSLFGQLSEVRIVYLNRFVQEVVSYFIGLVPNNSKGRVKLKDGLTDSDRWFSTAEIEGSPALKLDLSLRKPIIVMPRSTDSLDFLELDVVQMTVENTFQWLSGDKNDIGAVHVEILTVMVQDINLTVGAGLMSGESIIQDVKGLSVVIRRSLRDLIHQVPSIEVAIMMNELKAALSNTEYQIITECATSNLSETPHVVPALDRGMEAIQDDAVEHLNSPSNVSETGRRDTEAWITTKVTVSMKLVELSLHSGATKDSALATLQVSGAWLLYKSNLLEEAFLLATLKGFTVIDDREGTIEEYRLAIGKRDDLGSNLLGYVTEDSDQMDIATENQVDVTKEKTQMDITKEKTAEKGRDAAPVLTMLILDAKFGQSSSQVSLFVQRPQLLVALDFLLAIVEFFVPAVRGMLSNEENDKLLHIPGAIILDQPVYSQPLAEFALSPQTPLIVDDERFDHFVYDGKGGTLFFEDTQAANLLRPGPEPIVYVGNGKILQFKNVHIKNGEYLDSYIMLGANSSYSVSEQDGVFLETKDLVHSFPGERAERMLSRNSGSTQPMEFVIELQAVGPELTFYSTSKDVGDTMLSTKLLHAQLDVYSRLVLKDDTFAVSGSMLGLTVECDGIRIIEPFDTTVNFCSVSGKTNIQLVVSDIFMNYSFSILRLFLAVQEDILSFLRMTSKKVTMICSQFDHLGAIKDTKSGQTYAFWRPRPPPGFAVLGDCLTPLNEPPKTGVVAVNTSFVRVKKPVSFKLIFPGSLLESTQKNNSQHLAPRMASNADGSGEKNCTIWYPIAPPGYVALGCVASSGRAQPPLGSVFCAMASFVSRCALKDCITISSTGPDCSGVAFWRVDNSIGSFLPSNPIDIGFNIKAYELRHMIFGTLGSSSEVFKSLNPQPSPLHHDVDELERPVVSSYGRQFETVTSFRLVWWDQGTNSRKKLSIWRPVVPTGRVYLGDIAVQGDEPPNTAVILHDTEDGTLLKPPVDFQLVGKVKKQRGIESISFWLPIAPPAFVSLGCVACKSVPRLSDFSALRCIRSDMVTGDHFPEESLWDTSGSKLSLDPFSVWTLGNDVGTFFVRAGFKQPPKRFASRLQDPNTCTVPHNIIVDAKMRIFSAALFDDYGGLMVPLFNISLSGIQFSLCGRPDYMMSRASFGLTARSYNDKYDAWEPLIEPTDGFLRYLHDLNELDGGSQLRITLTKDLNLNISVSNTNMILQAYASWNNLSGVHESLKNKEVAARIFDGKAIINAHHQKTFYIIPQNRLGQDIFIRALELRGLSNIIRMPSGETKPVKVPVPKNMLEAHTYGKQTKLREMVTVIILDGELPRNEGLHTHHYTVEIKLLLNDAPPNELVPQKQSARTCGVTPEHSTSSGLELVSWNEIFSFKVASMDSCTIELLVVDTGKAGEPVGFYSAPLKDIAHEIHMSSFANHDLSWLELSLAKQAVPQVDKSDQAPGRVRCAVLTSPKFEADTSSDTVISGRKPGFIQISPAREGPWTTVRLNYAAPAACWRLGSDVVASEVSVKDGNRFVNIRSLVSVVNNTEFIIDLCLDAKAICEKLKPVDDGSSDHEDKSAAYRGIEEIQVEIDEYFETEQYDRSLGWLSSYDQPHEEGGFLAQGITNLELPFGWEVVNDWQVDTRSVKTSDGWVYAPDTEHLNWPESYDHIHFVNYARQRRWVRKRRHVSIDLKQQIVVGQLQPRDVMPLPLPGLTARQFSYVLRLRPSTDSDQDEYSWSSVLDVTGQLDVSGSSSELSEIYVSDLAESEKLLYCGQTSAESSQSASLLWFGLSINAIEIAKDIHSDPILDWKLTLNCPLSIVSFLPLAAEYSVFEKKTDGRFFTCARGIIHQGESVKVYNANPRNPLYLSLLPQGGWLPVHEAVLISHPILVPSKTLSLRSSYSERIVQVILEQSQGKERSVSKMIRVYVPYWIATSRCPPLKFRLIDLSSEKRKQHFSLSFTSNRGGQKIFGDITDDEILEGYTIVSALNLRTLGISVSIIRSTEEKFGPVKDLSPLGDMDGSVDLYACDADGNHMRLFISSKPCSYQSVPTKVLSVRPYMMFTNRLGEDLLIKLSSGDHPKILHSYDSRVSFVSRDIGEPEKLQVKFGDSEWCVPMQIETEDTITIVLRKQDGSRRFLRTEIRGYEEGSRFLVVFRFGSVNGPIRIENRTKNRTINFRQPGLGDDAWLQLQPLSTTNFSWEDPYGQRLLEAGFYDGNNFVTKVFRLDKVEEFSGDYSEQSILLHVFEMGDVKVARFTDYHERVQSQSQGMIEQIEAFDKNKMQKPSAQLELIIELAVLGVSLIDHRPRELLYLYLERVSISYYNVGGTSRFKLILGHLQLDNQLPLTVMPVMLAPEYMMDTYHPVFKIAISMSNESIDGIMVYPYIYIRATEKTWRVSIHEPIIWALVEFYNNLQTDRIPTASSVAQVDPEIRIDLIDVSDVRLKLSLETAPGQRPQGVLGLWSPILSAVGNALKIQIHLRKVMHRSRFMRRSAVMPAIMNRVLRDLIHNPLHFIFAVDVIGMTSSTLASLSKGFAELSTDGQFLQLRSKQGWSRRITGVSDGILQGTEALAQGVAFGVSGVVKKPVESARQYGILGLAHGLGRAFVGFIVQPVSGALDFFSLTVDGIGASCSRCLEIFTNKATYQRIRNPRAIHSNGVLKEYSEREAMGQMILQLAEGSRRFGCTEIFKEPSKYALSDFFEDHFMLPFQRILLLTNKRVMLLQCLALDKMDKKPCKILWDVPWEELMALELAKVRSAKPSHLILHLKSFKKSENFVRVVKCGMGHEEEEETLAVKICLAIQKLWKDHRSMKTLALKVPWSQRRVYFSWEEAVGKEPVAQIKPMIKPKELPLARSDDDERKFVDRIVNFLKIWSSEQSPKSRCTLCPKQVVDDGGLCSIWRPICPDGYFSLGDVAHVGQHPPNVAAVYRKADGLFATPVGYDLVWRNCTDDYEAPVSIWLPRAPEGFITVGCVAVSGFEEPQAETAYCVRAEIAEQAIFEEQMVWSAPDSFPWACYIYQVQSEALHFVALRQPKEESEWTPMRVAEHHLQ